MIEMLRRHWPVAAVLASAAMLGAAHAFEAAGYQPCTLCLRQREVYWAAGGIAAAGLALPLLWKNVFLPRGVALLLGGAFLVGAAIAAYHAGVEWKWWPGPAACGAAGGPLSANDIAAALNGEIKVVPCDEAAWRDPVANLSMAGWNALISAGLAGLSFFAAALPVRKADHD